MQKKSNFSRIDYLSLNMNDVRKHLANSVHFELSGDNVDKRLEQTSWVLATQSKQIAVSRHKIGKSLLKHQRNEFLLDDPAMNQTRFFVEYHRLQDPGLKNYFKSVPVRNRLRQLNMITDANDAVCSNRELADYLRYIDRLKSLDHASFIKHTVNLHFKLKIFKSKMTMNLC